MNTQMMMAAPVAVVRSEHLDGDSLAWLQYGSLSARGDGMAGKVLSRVRRTIHKEVDHRGGVPRRVVSPHGVRARRSSL